MTDTGEEGSHVADCGGGSESRDLACYQGLVLGGCGFGCAYGLSGCVVYCRRSESRDLDCYRGLVVDGCGFGCAYGLSGCVVYCRRSESRDLDCYGGSRSKIKIKIRSRRNRHAPGDELAEVGVIHDELAQGGGGLFLREGREVLTSGTLIPAFSLRSGEGVIAPTGIRIRIMITSMI